MVDQYRWALLNGTINLNEMNLKWWELRERYQGIIPPIPRSENDMDAGAKMHVAAHIPYVRYFVSFVLQFQFYRQLCIDSQQYNPQNNNTRALHKCDFSIGTSSQAAAKRFIKMLKLGASKPWQDVIEVMTGERKINADAILEYFKPLEEWLDGVIKQYDIPIGWESKFRNYFQS